MADEVEILSFPLVVICNLVPIQLYLPRLFRVRDNPGYLPVRR